MFGEVAAKERRKQGEVLVFGSDEGSALYNRLIAERAPADIILGHMWKHQ